MAEDLAFFQKAFDKIHFEEYLQRENLVSCNLVRLMDYSMQNI